ncbi:unnamed protein product [Ophioblennius macclurei]
MVTKRIRSEYMKKFKDPKWETYNKCYEERLKYRMARRLLEHAHNPWFWSGSDTDSDSGGRSPCSAPSKNQVQTEAGGDRAEAEVEECEQVRMDKWQEQQARTTAAVQRFSIPDEEGEDVSTAHGSQPEGANETKVLQEEREEHRIRNRGSKQTASLNRDQVKVSRGLQPPQNKSTKQTWHSQRVRPATTRQLKEENKDSRHPFALYGSGEKDADISARKTHNVGPAASTKEIHESALRARTRREVERQVHTQRTERRRAKSADVNKTRRVVQPEFNPWLTEYMRCFSARSR